MLIEFVQLLLEGNPRCLRPLKNRLLIRLLNDFIDDGLKWSSSIIVLLLRIAGDSDFGDAFSLMLSSACLAMFLARLLSWVSSANSVAVSHHVT